MDDTGRNSERGEGSRSHSFFLLLLLGFLVLYVLSIGPAWLASHKGLIPPRYLVIYNPILRVVDALHLSRPFGMYIHLFCPDEFDKNGERIEKH